MGRLWQVRFQCQLKHSLSLGAMGKEEVCFIDEGDEICDFCNFASSCNQEVKTVRIAMCVNG